MFLVYARRLLASVNSALSAFLSRDIGMAKSALVLLSINLFVSEDLHEHTIINTLRSINRFCFNRCARLLPSLTPLGKRLQQTLSDFFAVHNLIIVNPKQWLFLKQGSCFDKPFYDSRNVSYHFSKKKGHIQFSTSYTEIIRSKTYFDPAVFSPTSLPTWSFHFISTRSLGEPAPRAEHVNTADCPTALINSAPEGATDNS